MRGILVLIVSLVTVPAFGEIYRWTDADGRVHYGERPPGDNATRIDVTGPHGGSADTAPTEAARRERQRRLLESFEYERAREAEREAEAAERARQRDAQCERLRQHWGRLNHPGPLYETDGEGGRRYLDDDERAAQKSRLRPVYRQVCGESPD